MTTSKCPFCESGRDIIGAETVLGRYSATFTQCHQCGYTTAESPTWIEEAYASAIIATDVGYAQRCIDSTAIARVLLRLLCPIDGTFLDFGGGYGLFARMMRDRGFDFRIFDPYCDPLFASGVIEKQLTARRYSAVTAFEVMEHLLNPRDDLENIFSITDTLLFSTDLITLPAPPLTQWHYYGLFHGQHVSFYTRKTFEFFASHHDLNFYSNDRNMHLLTKRRIPPSVFKLLTQPRIAKFAGLFTGSKSLTTNDHTILVEQAKSRFNSVHHSAPASTSASGESNSILP